MKSDTVFLCISAIFLLSACVGADRVASHNQASDSALHTGAIEISDDGLEYFDKDMPNRAAHRSAWQFNNKGA